MARLSLITSVVVLAAAQWMFPGRRAVMAFAIGTGIGAGWLQDHIDRIEDRAIRGAALDAADRAFLVDFYRTLAAGARGSVLVRQTGRMMDHYLDGTGRDYRLDPQIFADNARVQAKVETLRARAARQPCDGAHPVGSRPFYMPHGSQIDSVFGLYHGQVAVTPVPDGTGGCMLRVRAEVPWVWPSYASLVERYGDARAERFPLPNAISLAFGRQHALFVGNGLGHHLEVIGLARSFLAFAEWTAPLEP